MKASLSPKDLALVVGASESSLKRWADDGRIQVTRTAGGHRRIAIQEALRFVRDTKMPVLRPDILGLPRLEEASQHREHGDDMDRILHDTLAVGDTLGAQSILVDLYLAGQSVAGLCDGPIRAAMTEIGEAWNHGREGIFVEHRATDICLQALSALRSLIALPTSGEYAAEHQPARPTGLGAAPAGDPYLIPSLMCACVLADAGYNTINLGPDTPADVLLQAVAAHQPKLVWLACAVVDVMPSPTDFEHLTATLAEQGTHLVVGGRVLHEDRLARHPNLLVCQTMAEMDKFARGLLQPA